MYKQGEVCFDATLFVVLMKSKLQADATPAPDAGPEEVTEGDAEINDEGTEGDAEVNDEGTEAAVGADGTEATPGEMLEVAEPDVPAERLPSPRELKKIEDARMLELIEVLCSIEIYLQVD